MAVIVFGDSITNGLSDSTGGGWTSRLWSLIFQNHSTEYAPGVVLSDHSVLELGIGGDTIAGVATRFENELAARIDVLEGGNLDDVVVGFAVGINDSRVLLDSGATFIPIEDFKSTYEKLIARVQKIGIPTFVVGLTCIDESKVNPCPWIDTPTSYIDEKAELFDEAARIVASNTGSMFVDIRPAFVDIIETEGADSLLTDGVHPNDRGHQLIADRVYETIKSKL